MRARVNTVSTKRWRPVSVIGKRLAPICQHDRGSVSSVTTLRAELPGLWGAQDLETDEAGRLRHCEMHGFQIDEVYGFWNPLETSRQQKLKSNIAPRWTSQSWPLSLNQIASGKPGAVQMEAFMQFQWQVDQNDIACVRAFVAFHAANPFVRVRVKRNLAAAKPAVDRSEFWKQMVGMRMTSVQRSGPNSAVARFLRRAPFPLSYDQVDGQPEGDGRRDLIASALRAHGGIRFPDKIAADLSENFNRLNADNGWDTALAQVNVLVLPAEAGAEREVARFLQNLLHGFGPKQSRNLLQSLGLTRYEIPIDSRITRWLNDFGFPVTLTATALADAGYYEFVLDGIQALCAASEVFPCVLDAAIFASFDGDAWTQENIIY